MGFFDRLFRKGEATKETPPLVGLWEQVGMIHPTRGVPVPWPKGSLNASVKEFLWFFEDGALEFGRFLADAEVSFDPAGRRFVCEKGVDKLLSGTWLLKDGRLLETFGGNEQAIQLGEVSEKRFIVEERHPRMPGVVLRVVYERRAPSPAKGSSTAGEEPLEVPRIIDRALWSRAKCVGIAFLTPENAPPGLGLILSDQAAASAIFDGWRKQLGPRDEAEMIRVAIIEGDIPNKAPGYTLTIGVDMSSFETSLRSKKSLGGVSVDPTTLGTWMRRMDTAPGGSPHLQKFKELFSKGGEYALVPVVRSGEIWDPDYGRQIVKRKLFLRQTKDIGPGDRDREALD